MTNDELDKSQKIIRWSAEKIYYNNFKSNNRKNPVKRGEVYYVNLGENIGSEENKIRPFVVIQSNSYNYSSPVFTGAIISTSTVTIPDLQIQIVGNYCYKDMKKVSKVLTGAIDLGQIRTLAKERILFKVCSLQEEMDEIDEKLLNAIGLSRMMQKKDNIIKSLNGKIEYLVNK